MVRSEDRDDVSATFIRVPNEIKLMFAEELGIHDVNALTRTCREMNALLTRFMYRRAKDSRARGGRPCFLLAVDDGNLAAVERFVEVGASVNMTEASADKNGDYLLPTALHLAATRGNVRMVQRLLDLGADPDAANASGARPVHTAASKPNGATVRCLLEAGQDVNVVDRCLRTPLHEAAWFGMTENVRVLLEMGAHPSLKDRRGSTPLVDALYALGNKASVRRIFDVFACLDDKFRDINKLFEPPRQFEEPNHMTIETLLAAKVDICDDSGALSWAVTRNWDGRYARR